jgi:MFS family permease
MFPNITVLQASFAVTIGPAGSVPTVFTARDCSRNLSKFLWYRIVFDFALWAPTWVLYLNRDLGMSFTTIMLLEMIFQVTIALTEIPTGIFADVVGRKWSLFGSGAVMLLTLLLFGLATSVWMVLVTWILWGLAATLINGADGAFLYESLAAAGREHEFARVFGRITSISMLSSVVAGIFGGWLVMVDPAEWITLDTPASATIAEIRDRLHVSSIWNAHEAVSALEGRLLRFRIAPLDSEATYQASTLPHGARFDSESREFTWQPSVWQTRDTLAIFRAQLPTRSVESTVPLTIRHANYRLPIFIHVVLMLIGLYIALLFREPPRTGGVVQTNPRTIMGSLWRLLKSSRKFQALLGFSAAIDVVFFTTIIYNQPLLVNAGLPVEHMGLFFSASTLVGAIGPVAMTSASARFGLVRTLGFAGFAGAACCLWVFFSPGLWAILPLIVIRPLLQGVRPATIDAMNALAGPDGRATVLSLRGIASATLSGPLQVLSGYVADHASVKHLFLVSAAALPGVMTVLGWLWKTDTSDKQSSPLVNEEVRQDHE